MSDSGFLSAAGHRNHLSFQMKHQLCALEIDAAFELTHPWTILVGPSGSGKSTILRAIAGLLRPQFARITICRQEQRQIAVDTAIRIFVPANERLVRWSAQRPALFPNMTVREQLRFVTRSSKPEGDRQTDATLRRFHLSEIADRRPEKLSGGEQQRVAIARAIGASDGRLLLLDEPFSGLDVALRQELIADLLLCVSQTKTPVLSVTHDPAEAFQLNAEVIKLRDGKVIAQGPPAIVLAEERARLLAQLSTQT